MESISQKRCSKCKYEKATDEFPKDRTRPDGHAYICKDCQRDKSSKYSANNKDKIAAAGRLYRLTHAEAYRAKNQRWQEQNRERWRQAVKDWGKKNPDRLHHHQAKHYASHGDVRRARNRQWFKDNPEKANAKTHRRRARIRGNGGTYTAAQWRDMCEWFGNVCLACGKSTALCVDHVVPISNQGRNTIDNLQPLCGACNSRKNAQTIDYRDPTHLAAFLASLT